MLGVRAEEIERPSPHELRDERPRLARGAEAFVHGELVERRPLRQICEREQPIHREAAFEQHAVEVAHGAAARVEVPVAHRRGQQFHQETSHLLAERRIERFAAAEGKDRDRVGRDGVDLLEQRARNLLAQIALRVADTLVVEVPRVSLAFILSKIHVHSMDGPTQAEVLRPGRLYNTVQLHAAGDELAYRPERPEPKVGAGQSNLG